MHREQVLVKARRMAHITYSVIKQSCHKIIVGKTYWKSVVLPSLLHGSSVLSFTNTQMRELQRVENQVYRTILGAPSYYPVCTLRSEVGASSMETRILGNQAKYLHYILAEGSPDLLKIVLQERIDHLPNDWLTTSQRFISDAGITFEDLRRISRVELCSAITQSDLRLWREELALKRSLTVYREWKDSIKGEEKLCDNRPASEIMYRARTNTLRLQDRNRFQENDTICFMCTENSIADLKHFLLYCPAYSQERNDDPNFRSFSSSDEHLLGYLLFSEEAKYSTKETIYRFWKKREKEIRRRNN